MDETKQRRGSKQGEVLEDARPPLDSRTTRHALEHLYCNVELANSPLAAHLPGIHDIPDIIQRAQALRNLLLDAIEMLRPLRSAPPHVLASRSYEVLSLRYVSGLSIEEVAERLSVGERQVYRDLRRAEEELAEILRSRAAAIQRDEPPEEEQNALQAELAELDASPQAIDLADLLQSALDTVNPLAAQRDTRLDYTGPIQGITVMAPPGILKQVLVQTLSAVVQSAEGQTVQVSLARRGDHAEMKVALPCQDPLPRADLLHAAMNMAQSIGLGYQIERNAWGNSEITLSTHTTQPPLVLIVEDNPGACELYKRYLQGSEWQAVTVTDPREADQVAHTLHPAAIILDLLMPEVNGWSVLQALRLSPEIKDIPVIVCSVVNDPELAAALGASASLKKPVSRLELLGTLKRVTQSRSVV